MVAIVSCKPTIVDFKALVGLQLFLKPEQLIAKATVSVIDVPQFMRQDERQQILLPIFNSK